MPSGRCTMATRPYSWIDADGVAALHGFIDRHLAPGGLLYLSYNAMPGWARDLPLQHMLRKLAQRETGSSDQRVVAAGAVIQSLFTAGAAALRYSPAAQAWGQGARPAYLAHENLAAGWRALWVDEAHTRHNCAARRARGDLDRGTI